MIVTAELSLYPLKDNYESTIISFIKSLKENPELHVHSHAMSTFVKGQQSEVFSSIDMAMETVNKDGAFSLVIKVINRDLPVEQGFLDFD